MSTYRRPSRRLVPTPRPGATGALTASVAVVLLLAGCSGATDSPTESATTQASETTSPETSADPETTEPEASESETESETETEAAATLPAGIELDAGWTTEGASTYEAPGADVEGVNTQLCDAAVWPVEGLDRLATRMVGNESNLERELVLYESAQRADEVVASIGAAVAACPSITVDAVEYTLAVQDPPLAPAGTVTYSELDATGIPNGDVHQFMVVGSAVLATVVGGELTEGSVAETAENLAEENVALIQDQLCGLRPEGCSG